MIVICVCGKSGSGKTTFARKLLEKLQESIYINVDEIAHDVLKKKDVINKIQKQFGEKTVENKEVNRKVLGKVVFCNKEKWQSLKLITWPYMEKMIDQIIQKSGAKIIILDYLFLPETKYFGKNSIKVLLNTSKVIRSKRIIARDMISENDFFLRDNASSDYQNINFDIIINDNDDFNNAIETILKKLES